MSSRIRGTAVLLAVSVATAEAQSGAVSGWYQEALEVRASPRSSRASRLIARTWTTARFTRSERVDEQLPNMKAIERVIVDRSTHDQYAINTARREILVHRSVPARPWQGRDSALAPATLEYHAEALGAGPRLLGRATTKWREHTIARVLSSGGGQWHAVIDTVDRVMFIATFADNPELADSALMGARRAPASTVPRGVILQSDETHTYPGRLVTHTEVKRLERRTVDPAVFDLPSYYRRIDSPSPGKP